MHWIIDTSERDLGEERLAEQEQVRLADDGAADGDPLTLSTGELTRIALQRLPMPSISAAWVTRFLILISGVFRARRPKATFSLTVK
jgi:hypothetical protein